MRVLMPTKFKIPNFDENVYDSVKLNSNPVLSERKKDEEETK